MLGQGVGGEIRCELQDAHGKALPGFSLNESVPLIRNSLAAPVAWRDSLGAPERTSLEKLPGGPVRIRFTMTDAWLFAFRFE